MNAEARAGVQLALLAIVRARHPDRVWSILRDEERSQLLDPSAGEICGRVSAPEDAELEIVLEREEIRPFKFLANLVELKVRVRNLTDKPKHLDRWGWTVQSGEVEPDTPPFWDADAMREAHEAAQRQHTVPSKVGPLDTTSGWIATAIPHEVSGRVGAYNVYAKDELGATYILLMPPRGDGNLWPT